MKACSLLYPSHGPFNTLDIDPLKTYSSFSSSYGSFENLYIDHLNHAHPLQDEGLSDEGSSDEGSLDEGALDEGINHL